MVLSDRINAFDSLGKLLTQFNLKNSLNTGAESQNNKITLEFNNKLIHAVTNAKHYNGWFTKAHVTFALKQWGDLLQKDKLQQWLHDDINSLQENAFQENLSPKKIGIIMAGNIPLVGFHDFLCVLITGHHALIKLSSNDTQLLPILASFLTAIAPDFKNYITFTKEKFTHFDAIIATGSNNTARYFEYYFGKVPNIIRKNRNSVALLTGHETKNELIALGDDIFRYFGLGCRSVSKLLIPKGYNFDLFFNAMFEFKDIINHAKYANNYDYNKAVYLMSNEKLLENGFLILKEGTSYTSPIATLFYQYYDTIEEAEKALRNDREQIQCIVANALQNDTISFGNTQRPSLTDYPDGINTLKFLLKLSS